MMAPTWIRAMALRILSDPFASVRAEGDANEC